MFFSDHGFQDTIDKNNSHIKYYKINVYVSVVKIHTRINGVNRCQSKHSKEDKHGVPYIIIHFYEHPFSVNV